jgi:hypothetical protein
MIFFGAADDRSIVCRRIRIDIVTVSKVTLSISQITPNKMSTSKSNIMSTVEDVLLWPKIIIAEFELWSAGFGSLFDVALFVGAAAIPWVVMKDRLNETQDVLLAYVGSGAAVQVAGMILSKKAGKGKK